jgi:hypothetical protein
MLRSADDRIEMHDIIMGDFIDRYEFGMPV